MESLIPSSRPAFALSLQLLVWWVANNIYAIHAQTILQNPAADPYLFIHLTFIQLLVGIAAATSMQSFLTSTRQPTLLHSLTPKAPQTPPPSPSLINPLFILVALAHLVGTALSNASYRSIGATATLVWKLTEPLTTILLKRLILRENTTLLSFIGIQAVLAGVLLFSGGSFTLPALSPILIANLAFPIRNVLLKSTQRSKQHPPLSLLDRFIALYSPAVLVASVLVFGKNILFGGDILPSLPILTNAILFNTYQLASLALLEKLDPLTHSVTNTLKRFTGILVAALYTQQPLMISQLLGLLMTVFGFPVYVFGSNLSAVFAKHLHGNRPRSSVMVLVGVAFAAAFATLMPRSDKHLLNTSAERSANETSTLMETRQQNAKSFVIHIDSRYREVENPVLRNYEEAKQIDDGDNVGNFVWQYAAYFYLPDFSNVKTCNQSYPVCHQDFIKGTSLRMVSYRPGANYFHSKGTNLFGKDIEAIRDFEIVPLLIGIGAQAYFTKNSTDVDLFPGRDVETTEMDVKFQDNARTLFALLSARKQPMLFRGDFTLRAAQIAGYAYGLSTGCPTLFLNKHVDMGVEMQKRYSQLAKRVNDTSLKVAINIKEGLRFMNFVRYILDRYPNSYIYAQGKGDMIYLEKRGIPFERVRLFTNVEDWRESLREMDVSIGARIHGNMLALAVLVPVYVIAPDHRVTELAQRMKVPYTTYYSEDVPTEGADIAKLVSESKFDGAEFDKNRCEIAKVYRRVFSSYGFEAASHVKAISETC